MPGFYNKDDLKENLELENIFDLLNELGGEPEYNDTGIVSRTICHNNSGEGSRKLYYYENSRLFRCYTDCDDTFDVFELVIKAMRIQRGYDWELYDAMSYVAGYFGLAEAERPEEFQQSEYWEVFKRHDIPVLEKREQVILPEYNPVVLTRFSYPRIPGWEKEGILPEVYRANGIGYYAGGEQITIPHFDIEGRLIGIRGRQLVKDIADRYGKYRPIVINGKIYTHPLSMNLYNLNNSKKAIAISKTAIVFEAEKSCLMYQSYYGKENDITVAVCGSSISSYQVDLLESLGVREIIVAYDRQFQEIGDEEFLRWKRKLTTFHDKYCHRFAISAIFDKNKITSYKASPIDEGREKFEKLLQARIIPKE